MNFSSLTFFKSDTHTLIDYDLQKLNLAKNLELLNLQK